MTTYRRVPGAVYSHNFLSCLVQVKSRIVLSVQIVIVYPMSLALYTKFIIILVY